MAASRNDRGVRNNGDFEEEEQKTWAEVEVQLPAFPEDEANPVAAEDYRFGGENENTFRWTN